MIESKKDMVARPSQYSEKRPKLQRKSSWDLNAQSLRLEDLESLRDARLLSLKKGKRSK